MALLEELLKASKTHSQTVIVALIAVIAVGTVGGGLWIHNLQTMLDNRDALRALDQKDALVMLHRNVETIGILDEAVKRHEAYLEQASSKLKQLSDQHPSASSNHEIQQIAERLNSEREDLEARRADAVRIVELTRSNLTGAGRALNAPSLFPLLLLLSVLAAIAIGIGFWRYRRRHP